MCQLHHSFVQRCWYHNLASLRHRPYMATRVSSKEDFFYHRVLISTVVLASKGTLLRSLLSNLLPFCCIFQLLTVDFLRFHGGGIINGLMGCFSLAHIALAVTAATSAGAGLSCHSRLGAGLIQGCRSWTGVCMRIASISPI